jgi:hypothetical protein
MSVIKSAVAQLGLDEEKSGRGVEFKALEAFLSPDMAPEDYSEIAAKLGVTEPTLRQMVSRLRKKFRVFLRSAIAGTLTDADEKQVDEEILTLRAALRD